MERSEEFAAKAAKWWREHMLCYYLVKKLDRFEQVLTKRIEESLQLADSLTLESNETGLSAVLFWSASDAQINTDFFPPECTMKISLKDGIVVDKFQIWPPI